MTRLEERAVDAETTRAEERLRQADEAFATLDEWLGHGEWGESHPLYTRFTKQKSEFQKARREPDAG